MTEEVTRIIPAEIGLVRTTCRECGVTSEAKVESLHKLFANGSCPHCNAMIGDDKDVAAFRELKNVLQKLNSIQDAFDTKFVLVAPSRND